jgi:site-specific recombinase XerD
MDNLKGPQPDTSSLINTRAGRNLRDPLDYSHPYGSMRQFAQLLALRHDSTRTRHSYYRAMRLVHEHFGADPATLGEDHFRDYLLYVKTRKGWKPKTIRQTAACARLFFIEMLGCAEWKLFSQLRIRDHDELPAVLTREQVARLLGAIRLRYQRSCKFDPLTVVEN